MTVPVERPDHVHPTRMRQIPAADLLAGLGYPGQDLASVRALITKRTPVWDPAAAARALAGTPAAAEAIAAADALLDRDVDFVSPEHGRSGLYALHYLLWTKPLVTGYLLTGDEAYPACFDRLFDRWYASRDQVTGGWPGLDVVWYSLGVWARASVLVPALATFAGSPWLRDETVAAALATLLGGARWSAEEHDEFRPGNWQLVCAGELLHVAAFLPDAPEAAGWAATGRARLTEHLDLDFYPDGGHHERSPGYHELCLQALQRAAAVSRRDHGFALDDHPAYVAAHDWLATMTTPGGWVPPWQDSTTVWPAELLSRGSVDPPPGDAGTHLVSSGYVVLRGPDTYLGLNAGRYVEHELESHSHLAVTDFVASAWGAPLALEAGGPPTYDDPEYQSWYRDPRAHNVVTVDGHQISTDRRVAVDGTQLTGPVQAVAVHHHGYPVQVSRRIIHVTADPAYWLVSDRVEGEAAATWSILAPDGWQLAGAGFRSTGRPGLTVLPAGGVPPCSIDQGPGQVPADGSAEFRTLHALRLRSAAGRFDVLLVPQRDEQPWQIRPLPGGWEISGSGVTDTLIGRQWQRRTAAGEVTASASWDLPDMRTCDGDHS